MDSTRRGRQALLTAAGVVVALGVVAVASSGSTSTGSGATSRASDILLDVFLTLYLIVLVAGAVLFLYLLALRRKLSTQPGAARRRDMRNVILLVGCAALALLTARGLGERTGPLGATLPEAAPFAQGGRQDPDRQTYDPSFAWIPVLVTVGLISLAVFGVWWSDRSRRRSRGERRGSLLADALATAVDESLDDLRAESDPRRAVIAAYARLERVLESYGLPRRPSEAPLEFLSRMLGDLSVSPPAARRLTELFERAKFSQHAVGPEMKEHAIRALEVVRDDLRAARARAEQERAAALQALAQRPASR